MTHPFEGWGIASVGIEAAMAIPLPQFSGGRTKRPLHIGVTRMGLKKAAELANAERVADEAIAALEAFQNEVWNYVDGMADEIITGILDRAKAKAAELRQELEGQG